MEPETITSQDWYRVRRGEDEIAWERLFVLKADERVVFADRAAKEWAFLEDDQREAVLERVARLVAETDAPDVKAVAHGKGRMLVHADDLRIVFSTNADRIEIATVRGGRVLDPENSGPPPVELSLLNNLVPTARYRREATRRPNSTSVQSTPHILERLRPYSSPPLLIRDIVSPVIGPRPSRIIPALMSLDTY